MTSSTHMKPTAAFVGASWAALGAGILAYLVGLWNSNLQASEKGYYFAILFFGLFAAVSLQKTVRDQAEGIRVTSIYYGICWFALISALLMLAVGLFNAEFARVEKGFYAMGYILSLFAAVTVQKNVRDSGPKEKRHAATAADDR